MWGASSVRGFHLIVKRKSFVLVLPLGKSASDNEATVVAKHLGGFVEVDGDPVAKSVRIKLALDRFAIPPTESAVEILGLADRCPAATDTPLSHDSSPQIPKPRFNQKLRKFSHDQIGVLVAPFKDDHKGDAQARVCEMLEETFKTMPSDHLLKGIAVYPVSKKPAVFDQAGEFSKTRTLSSCRRTNAIVVVTGRYRHDTGEVLCRFLVNPKWCSETGLLSSDHDWQSLPSFDMIRHIAEQQKRQLSYLSAVAIFAAGHKLYKAGAMADACLLLELSVGGFTLRPRQEAITRCHIAFTHFKLLDLDQGRLQFGIILTLARQNIRDDHIFYCVLRVGVEAVSAFGSESRFEDMENILKILETLGRGGGRDKEYDAAFAMAMYNAIILYDRSGSKDAAIHTLLAFNNFLQRNALAIKMPSVRRLHLLLNKKFKFKKNVPHFERTQSGKRVAKDSINVSKASTSSTECEPDQYTLEEQAWTTVSFNKVCKTLLEYYDRQSVKCFTYDHFGKTHIRVPLYVRPEWQSLTHSDLMIEFADTESAYLPTKAQRDFLDFHILFYKRDREWNDRIFRLSKMTPSPNKLALSFVLGRYWDAFACQYILEHETRMALAQGNFRKHHLPLRHQFAGSAEAIETFCEKNVTRMGISNLLLLKQDDERYVPLINKRGDLSLGDGYDTVSSGIFSVVTTPRADKEPRHKVLEEIWEELYGKQSMEHEQTTLDPYSFYKEQPISDLLRLIDKGSARFEITGFCIDLVRMVPDLTCLLIVNDPAYYQKYSAQFRVNKEYHASSQVAIPSRIDNLHDYLRSQFPGDPESTPSKIGFDPSVWTLPGGFCFYQGMKKAVTDKLL